MSLVRFLSAGFLNLGIIGRRHPAFLNLLTTVIHAMWWTL